ncbi:OstA-like protein [candidate division KSB1 bacterium]
MSRAQDKILNYKADLYEDDEIDGERVRKLTGNVKFVQGAYTLESDEGIFFLVSNRIVFEGNVRFYDGIKSLNADKVVYDNAKRIFYFDEGIELIRSGKVLRANRGIYYRDEGRSFCEGNVLFRDSVNTFKCDSAYFFEENENIKAFSNLIFDSADDEMTVTGEEGMYFSDRDFIEITDTPKLIIRGENSDVVITSERLDISAKESAVTARGNVEIVRDDLTARCAIANYVTEDDEVKIVLIENPIITEGSSTIRGDSIEIFFKDKNISKLIAHKNAEATIGADSSSEYYNELKGKTIFIYLQKDSAERMVAERNAESIYYLMEDGKIKGANRATGEKITLLFSEGTIKRVLVDGESEGIFYPSHLLKLMPDEK